MGSIILHTIVSLIILNICCGEKEEPDSSPPNIIFMMSDDHGYQAISAYGHGLNQTPNIDRLAEEGTMFTRACVTNSLCAPSRAVMLTGKHSFVNGQVDNHLPFDWDQETYPKILQSHGYQTALIGKIHLDGRPQGFDFSMVLPGQGDYYNPDFIVNGVTTRFEGYCTDLTTEYAIKWLDEMRDKDKPFCLLYHQKAPHAEWMPGPDYLTAYDRVTFEPPFNYFDDYTGIGTAAKEQNMRMDGGLHPRMFLLSTGPDGKSTGLERVLSRMNPGQRARWDAAYGPKNSAFLEAGLEGKELSLWKYNRFLRNYLATIRSVDDGVGKLQDYLAEKGLAENTIVVYTSDQGFFLGEHGWYDKRFMYEEAFRTPLLVRYPKEIRAGARIDRLVQNLDLAPTLLDYAGIPAPSSMQGESFRDLVGGKTTEWREEVYYTYYEFSSIGHAVKRHYGIAGERYKLIHFYYDIDEWELYDLEKDPHEMQNVYGRPEYADVQEMMHGKLDRLREAYGDSDENNRKYLEAWKSYFPRWDVMKTQVKTQQIYPHRRD